MNGILVIAYYFADMLGGAVRTNKFLKYWLRQPESRVRVITARKAGGPPDQSLLDELRGDLKVARTPWVDYLGWQVRVRQQLAWLLPSSLHYDEAGAAPRPSADEALIAGEPVGFARRPLRLLSDFLVIPDAYWGWVPFVLYYGCRWLREYKVIYSTSPPETGHMAALFLKHLTGRPWVADFRDPWVGNSFRKLRTDALRRWNARCEAAVVSSADRILCNTDLLREDLLARYPNLDPAKFITVWNGFDEEDFLDLQPCPRRDPRRLILHTGSFYGLRTPVPFLTALGLLKEQGFVNPREVAVEFIGTCSPEIAAGVRETVARYGLQSMVTLSPPLPYRETLARQMSADLLLLVGHHEEGHSMQIPGKAFEYIRTGKPVLYLFPAASATARLFEQADTGLSRRADPRDTTSIAVALRTLLDETQQAAPVSSPLLAEPLRRRYQAACVFQLLQELSRSTTAGPRGVLNLTAEDAGRAEGCTLSLRPPRPPRQ